MVNPRSCSVCSDAAKAQASRLLSALSTRSKRCCCRMRRLTSSQRYTRSMSSLPSSRRTALPRVIQVIWLTGCSRFSPASWAVVMTTSPIASRFMMRMRVPIGLARWQPSLQSTPGKQGLYPLKYLQSTPCVSNCMSIGFLYALPLMYDLAAGFLNPGRRKVPAAPGNASFVQEEPFLAGQGVSRPFCSITPENGSIREGICFQTRNSLSAARQTHASLRPRPCSV